MNQKISFGVSTWLWTSPFNNESIHLFPKIKKMGFDAVEIPVEAPELIDAKVIKKALAKEGLKPIICGAFGPTRDLTHEDPAVHQQCFEYLQQCFDLCNEVGADFVAGPMYSAVGKARMVPPEQRKKEWSLAVENLHKACQMAAEHELSLALEPLNRFESDLVNTTEDVVRLVEEIDHPAAKVMVDSFHMTIEERDLEAALLLAGDRLIHVQVSENYRGTPGTGLTPWESFASGLKKINYQGTISIESFTTEIKELAGAVCFWKNMAESQDAFAKEGLQFLKQLFHEE
ncbi:MAG TPA: sugar phosphate isomerase/epimerase family protein [Saprospiraceae bacterium]|nr:sugar phosphate isomerase/epimerase family protein [Saprospiraceae bacterium]